MTVKSLKEEEEDDDGENGNATNKRLIFPGQHRNVRLFILFFSSHRRGKKKIHGNDV